MSGHSGKRTPLTPRIPDSNEEVTQRSSGQPGVQIVKRNSLASGEFAGLSIGQFAPSVDRIRIPPREACSYVGLVHQCIKHQ